MTLETTRPDAPTACVGWRAHDLVAHLAAGAAEMATHVEATLVGKDDRATSGFAEREAPFVALPDDELRTRLVNEALRLRAAVEALAEAGMSAPFSGRRLTAAELRLHGRSEAAIHRWDLAGDDGVGQELLSDPELTRHAVLVLNSMLEGSAEAPAARAAMAGFGDEPVRLTFGSAGQPDVVLVAGGQTAHIELADASTTPTMTTDPATRLLALWGRRSPERRVVWHVDPPTARRFASFLWPRRPGRPGDDGP